MSILRNTLYVNRPPQGKEAPSPVIHPYAPGERSLFFLTVWGRFFRRNKNGTGIPVPFGSLTGKPYTTGERDSLAKCQLSGGKTNTPGSKDQDAARAASRRRIALACGPIGPSSRARTTSTMVPTLKVSNRWPSTAVRLK